MGFWTAYAGIYGGGAATVVVPLVIVTPAAAGDSVSSAAYADPIGPFEGGGAG